MKSANSPGASTGATPSASRRPDSTGGTVHARLARSVSLRNRAASFAVS
jgi:hypothetical protein